MAKESDDGGGFSGKRNKSWREIDAKKGRSRYPSRHDEVEQQRLERSPSYQRYKLAADALFTGGELPEGLAKTFDPDGKRKSQKEAMLKLREMERRAWVEGVVEYLEKFPELPEDAYFLDSLLDHPRDRVVGKSLAKLEELASEGKLAQKAPKSLDQRLKSLELTSMDADIQDRARALREKLRM